MKNNTVKITKSEFLEKADYYFTRAHSEPIYIDKNGRPDVIIVSLKKFKEMTEAKE